VLRAVCVRVVANALLVASAACSGRAATRPPTSDAVADAMAEAATLTDAAPPTDVNIFADAAPDAQDAAAAAAPPIEDWPIAWPDERDQAMVTYRRIHNDPAARDTVIAPRMIVLHYTAGGSAKGTKQYFDRPKLEASRAKLREGGDVNVSAHFLVDRDGTIFRLMPETRMARHAIGVNHVAIGVENVGDEDKYPLTDAQVEANVALIRDLASRHQIELLVGHHEVRALEGTDWFVERDPTYRNKKPDPGARFMTAVRAKITDLGLKGPDDVKPAP
jgi:hypothetical protein